jgi:hypothetical protein
VKAYSGVMVLMAWPGRLPKSQTQLDAPALRFPGLGMVNYPAVAGCLLAGRSIQLPPWPMDAIPYGVQQAFALNLTRRAGELRVAC